LPAWQPHPRVVLRIEKGDTINFGIPEINCAPFLMTKGRLLCYARNIGGIGFQTVGSIALFFQSYEAAQG